MECRLCKSTHVFLKWTITRFEPSFEIYQCQDCGFEFQEISDESASRFYNEAYYSGKAAYSYIDERNNENPSRIVWKKRIEILKKQDFSTGEKNFLDVGCSFGGLMQSARSADYNPFGIEVSNYSGNYAKERFENGHLYIGNCEIITLPKEFFSIVTMIEVIEHIRKPMKALKNIFSAMKPGGVFLVQTADMAGLQAVLKKDSYHYYLPGHLSYFTRKNLTLALKRTGFSKIRFFGGVEFGLIPKLLKSRASFHEWTDYLAWFRISFYHYLSKVSLFGLHLTSSMVVMAWK